MAGAHLAISVLIAIATLFLVFFVWHPSPLQIAVGVTNIFLMLLAIDVVLGPLLTLLVASSPTKKTLKFDLMVIGVLQLSAYIYGMYNITKSRPVYIAFDVVRFEVVQADTVVRPQNMTGEYSKNSYLKPQWVAVRPYKNADEQTERMRLEMMEAIAPSMRAELYIDINDANSQIKKATQPLSELKKYNHLDVVHKHLTHYPSAVGFVPLKSKIDMSILVDTNGQVITIVDLRPWN